MLSVPLCFSMEMSASFAALGLFSSVWIYTKTSNRALASGVFFFFTMELLQAIQYLFIADTIDSPACDNPINKFLTLVGFAHICAQPYFCHVINASLTKNAKYLDRYVVIKRLCIIGGAMLFFRHFLAPMYSTLDYATGGTYASTEWLRGEKLCTFRGNLHLAWSIPMADPTYIIPGAAIHSFCMFAPFLALYEKKGMVIQGIFLFVFGPFLAGVITPNLMEQASIWCFFSIAQIAIMLFLIRETLITHWGKGAVHASLLTGSDISSKQSATEGKSASKKKAASKHAE
jgi:hypothetical protein